MSKAQESTTIFGIDIGGTGIKAALVDPYKGKLLMKPIRLATPQPSTVKAILSLIDDLIDRLKWQGPIGCGFPGIIKDGIVYSAANLTSDWIGVNLALQIKKLSRGTVKIINDADAAAIAEMHFGAGKDRNRHGGGVVLLITLGTGVGSALFVDGHLVPNTEFGHIEMDGVDAEKLTATVIREQEQLSWNVWGGRVNRYLQLMEKLLSPNCIIIGGGVSESPEKFFSYLDLNTEIIPAKMGNDAGIIGAALAIKKLSEDNLNFKIYGHRENKNII